MSVEIVCPRCASPFNRQDPAEWVCTGCGFTVALMHNIPIFSGHPEEQNPQQLIERGAEKGTEWRRRNWQFIEKTAAALPASADVLDVGAGRGDFKPIFSAQSYLGVDIYPYPEIDLAVDLIECCPFKEGSFDLIVMANVIEHVYEYRNLISCCSRLLKPGGRLLITVPFLLKLHQEPVDFHRYTRYTLEKAAAENALEVDTLDAYTNPLGLLDEGIGDAWQHIALARSGLSRFFFKLKLALIQNLANSMKKKASSAQVRSASIETNPYILGYLCLFRKPAGEINK